MSSTSKVEKAAIALFQEHFEHLVVVVDNYVHSIPVAEDIVQDLFIKLWEKNRLINATPAFLYTCARNFALNYLRDFSSKMSLHELTSELYILDEQEEELSYMNRLEEIHRAVESLPPQCQTVLRMIYFENKHYAEVAQEMGISINTVKTHIYLAIKTLRKNFTFYLCCSL
ncbi:MAG TPA: RNA polymerase sigma-70 factor [Bacteroides reticulotermitis]|nr:RNA polymerase sigma-70 factor [Bacteroides reticulotermitis]